ncbi:MAG: hypothetical protein ACM3UY_02160 [Methanocella sp.]
MQRIVHRRSKSIQHHIENKSITKVAVKTQTKTVRVKFDQLDKLMNLVDELVINKIALLQVTAENQLLSSFTKEIQKSSEALSATLSIGTGK